MTDLGGGVTLEPDEPWDDLGRHDTPGHPETAGRPLCPICETHSHVEVNTSRAGGLICWTCGTVFTTAPGEWAANTEAREIYQREYRKGA